MTKGKIDATQGSLPRGILVYAFPLMISTLLQLTILTVAGLRMHYRYLKKGIYKKNV